MNRVLVVGERPEEAKALAFRLGLSGYESSSSTGEVAVVLRAVFAFKPCAIVIDVRSGEESREHFKLLERVTQIPILVLGDSRGADDLVWYLEEGAVAYLPKPVSPNLIAARLATVLRRATQSAPDGIVTAGSITLDLARHQVRRNGQIVPLTPTEFRLLQILAEHSGRPCSQRLLLEQVWGEGFGHCAHYLRLYMGYLRQKLEADPRNPRLLITEWGIGYRLVADRQDVPVAVVQPARAVLT